MVQKPKNEIKKIPNKLLAKELYIRVYTYITRTVGRYEGISLHDL